MCFADSVLQVIVYCPSFHQLFAELSPGEGAGDGGLGSEVSGGLGASSGMNGVNGLGGTSGSRTAAEASAYLLVEATVEFLSEFVVDSRSKDLRDPKGKASVNASVDGKIASGSAMTSRT